MSVKRHRSSQVSAMGGSMEDPLAGLIRQRALAARMAVSNGHQTNGTNIPSYLTNFEINHELIQSMRTPLESAPALVANCSTAESNLEDWERKPALSLKRSRFDDLDEKDCHSAEIREAQLDDYIKTHGPLSFNEEF